MYVTERMRLENYLDYIKEKQDSGGSKGQAIGGHQLYFGGSAFGGRRWPAGGVRLMEEVPDFLEKHWKWSRGDMAAVMKQLCQTVNYFFPLIF